MSSDLDALIDLICPGPPSIKINKEQDERLSWLCNDDERQKEYVLKIIELQRVLLPEAKEGGVSAKKKASLEKIRNDCERLSACLELDWPKLSRALLLLSKSYDLRVKEADPEGKRHKKLWPATRIAQQLIELIESEKLSVEISKDPASDLSKLFRLCCEISGVPPPQNTAYHFDQHLNKSRPVRRAIPIFSDREWIDWEVCKLLGIRYPPYLDWDDQIHDHEKK